MKLQAFFTVSLLAGLAYSAPTSNTTEASTDDKVIVTADFFPDELAIYTAEHDIVNILLPLNALNFDEDSDDEENENDSSTIFFVLADTVDGKRVDKGLYIRKKGQVTKLLDNGRDASAANDDTKTAYFAAQDGLYSYDESENKAVKYGTVTDSIISLAKVNGSDLIYILTEDNILYKVIEEGTKKEKVEDVVNAQQIVLDYDNNLYYYTADKQVYILGPDGVKKAEGLPENPTHISVLKPPFVLDHGIPVVANSQTYIVYNNGTSELGDFEFAVRPTAFCMEATLIQYYAYNKKIYEYNILTLLFNEFISDIKQFLEDKSNSISEIATRSRSDLKRV